MRYQKARLIQPGDPWHGRECFVRVGAPRLDIGGEVVGTRRFAPPRVRYRTNVRNEGLEVRVDAENVELLPDFADDPPVEEWTWTKAEAGKELADGE